MRKALIYLWLLIKRFLKTPAYVALICMIPILALGLFLAAKQDNGVLTIAIYNEAESDDEANRLVDELSSMKSVLQIVAMDSKETAVSLVVDGKADSAWIIKNGYSTLLAEYAKNGFSSSTPIEVFQQEENELLLLSRIRLFGLMYPDIAFDIYQDSAESTFDKSIRTPMSEDELREVYDRYRVEDKLFNMATVESTGIDNNYVVAPLRGLLCVLITLCGFTAVVFLLDDEEKGAFSKVYYGHKKYIGVFYVLAASIPAGIASLVALAAVGQLQNLAVELGAGLLFVIDSGAFCLCVKRLVKSKRIMTSLLPFMTIVLLLLTPVFFNLRQARFAQFFVPGFYYLNLVIDSTYLWKSVAHFLLLGLLCML